jgi:Putative prokaryotic signal transducing protein
MDSEQAVVLTVVASEPEAEALCGLLGSAGIECAYRDTEAIGTPLEDFIASGPREVLVHVKDLEAAEALLPGAES